MTNNEMIFGSDGGYISDGFTGEMIEAVCAAASEIDILPFVNEGDS